MQYMPFTLGHLRSVLVDLCGRAKGIPFRVFRGITEHGPDQGARRGNRGATIHGKYGRLAGHDFGSEAI